MIYEKVSDALTIKELDIDDLAQAFPVVSQLRTHLSVEEYVKIVKAMKPSGYRAICLFEGEDIVAYAGFAEQLNLYNGNHIWVYDLVTDEAKRSKGYGQLVLSCIEKYAKEQALTCVVLSSRLQWLDAHHFYEKLMGYEKTSYTFKKQII